jgi:hypothetical protein
LYANGDEGLAYCLASESLIHYPVSRFVIEYAKPSIHATFGAKMP